MQAHKNAVKNIYSAHSIQEIIEVTLKENLSKAGDDNFAKFQKTILEKCLPGFTYEFFSKSTASLCSEGGVLSMSAVNLNLPDEVLFSYLANYQYDELTPLIYANPGRSLSYTHVCPQELVEQHPMFINHCYKYGIYHDTAVGFIYPGHDKTFIVFDYMGDKGNTEWTNLDHTKLELCSFPFALAWLYRLGLFDESKFRSMLTTLVGFTESSLLNARKYINAPHQNLKDQATDLGIKYGTLKDSLGSIKTELIEKLNLHVDASKNIPLRVLDKNLSFLEMMGDHTTPLKPPLKPPFWP